MDTKELLRDGQRARLIPGLPFREYVALPAVNISTLLKFLGHTDAKAKRLIECPRPESRAQLVGHAVHAAILEPEVFETMYSTEPVFPDLRTKAGRDAKAEWKAAHADQATLPPEDYAAVVAMRDALAASDDPEIRELFDGKGQNELTVVARDEETGLLLKGRIDRLTALHGYPTVIDLKTADGLSDFSISSDLAEWKYHIRLAWYIHLLSLIKPADWLGVFIWLDKTPPHECRATQLDEHCYEDGNQAARHCLDRYAACVASGQWKSHRHGIEVVNPRNYALMFAGPKE